MQSIIASNSAVFAYRLSDSIGHTPSASAFHRAVADTTATKLISRLLATCEVLRYDLFATHGASLQIGPAGQLVVLKVSDDSIADSHGVPPSALAMAHADDFCAFHVNMPVIMC